MCFGDRRVRLIWWGRWGWRHRSAWCLWYRWPPALATFFVGSVLLGPLEIRIWRKGQLDRCSMMGDVNSHKVRW